MWLVLWVVLKDRRILLVGDVEERCSSTTTDHGSCFELLRSVAFISSLSILGIVLLFSLLAFLSLRV